MSARAGVPGTVRIVTSGAHAFTASPAAAEMRP
jgi:hypothetical protein